MTMPSANERDLFADLTQTLMELKDAPHARVQAVIEERFRRFLSSERPHTGGSLQITWTCSLPEGAGSFAIYRTEYQTQIDKAEARPATSSPSHRPSADIIPFPIG